MDLHRLKACDGIAPLTTTEKEIIRLICEGLSSSEIASRLFRSTRTIEGYRRNILEKTDSRNVAGIVIFAIENGLVPLKRQQV